MGAALVKLGEVRAALASIDATLLAHPEIRERTALFLAADPAGEELAALEVDTVKKEPLHIKVDPATTARADALIPGLAADPVWGSVIRSSRAAVLRLAMVEGLTVLEGRYGIASPPLAPAMVEDTPAPARKAALRQAPPPADLAARERVELAAEELDLLAFLRALPPEQRAAALASMKQAAEPPAKGKPKGKRP